MCDWNEENMTPDKTETPELEPISSADSMGKLNGFLDSPEFQAAMRNEFPEDAAEWSDPVSRRRFLGLMGASIALAGAGCNLRPAPERKILPYTTQPDELTPGVPLFFATAAPLSGYGTGILVRSHEGRPIKIEGNPSHPSSLGGVGVYAQATVLDLYDPDRSRGATNKGQPSTYEVAIGALRKELFSSNALTLQPEAKSAIQLRIVTETVTSPSLADQITKLLEKFSNAKWIQHDPVSRKNVNEGIQKAFGRPLNVTYDFTKADVVLSLDADFLCSGPGHVRYSRDFASRRKVRRDKHDGIEADKMSRLYAVECMPTNTGASADHRLALTSSQIESFARELAKELGVAGVPAAGDLPEPAKAWLKPLAADLKDRKGKTAILVGDHFPASLHALAFAINSALGNIGQTVIQSPAIEVRPPEGKASDLKTLTAEMAETTEKNKKVEVLLILSSNPAYTAPADVPFAAACQNVPFKFHLGTHQDETAVLCEWHIPEAHYLETWGDIRGHDGTIAIQQPLIAPLYHGKSIIEFLADLTQGPVRLGLDIVKSYWRNRFTTAKSSGEFEIFWQVSVRSGVVAEPASPPNSIPLDGGWATGSSPVAAAPAEGQYELNFRPDPTLYDGRYANNGWLQELPKPMTLLTWDNAAFVSPATADKLAVKTSYRWTGGEHGRAEVCVIELTVKIQGKDTTIKAPVWILPGHADGAVTVHLGSGRPRAGQFVGNLPHEPNADNQPVRGFNAYAIRSVDSLGYATGLMLRKTSKKYFLACVQGRWSTIQTDPTSGEEMDRMPVRRGTLKKYKDNPAFAKIPPMAAGETELIVKNTPFPKHDETHDHKHDEQKNPEHEKHSHDERLIPLTMYKEVESLAPDVPEGQRRRWGMAIDLSACTGCSSCVIACQSENNSPVVGKEQVTRGRAMHWIRIDRYYGGHQEAPNADVTSFQPVMCVQCENAPCEIVCPVGATVHSTDGLNDMAYNRCVGTRYCSNNCPYKVRRFNFLTFADWSTETLKLGRNPDVTVRSRGVMEKCTFCVQRIRGAEIVAEREGRAIQDGEILTACQSACPSGAIVFGDLNDSKSVVARWKNEPTNYGLLAELNTRPRLTHLAILRNPNEKMPKGA
jgi:MoCo/4Fe-4S cofactor protein with predicted Tat translocation signal